MPSLKLFGKPTIFAGDDLRFFTACASVYRLLQLSLAVSLLLVTKQAAENNDELIVRLEACDPDDGLLSSLATNDLAVLYAYDSVSIILAAVGLATVSPMFFISGLGTPTDTEPRKALFVLCYINLFLVNSIRILCFCFGMLSIFVLLSFCECLAEDEESYDETSSNFTDYCPNVGAWLAVMITLVVTHGIDFIAAGVTILYFFCKLAIPSGAFLSTQSRWKRYLQFCCGLSSLLTCCVFGGAEAIRGDFGDFALVLANYFNNNGILDMTPSDVVAGLMMVQRLQRQEQQETRARLEQEARKSSQEDVASNMLQNYKSDHMEDSNFFRVDYAGAYHQRPTRDVQRSLSHPQLSLASISSSNSIIEPINERLSERHPREVYLLAEGARFIPIAQATYTWFSFLLEHPLFGCWRLLYRTLRRCCSCKSSCKGNDKIIGDSCCQTHFVALEAITGLKEDDIVYASFEEGVVATPYTISIDHEWKSVVVAIRGTMSMESLLADITIKPEELKRMGEKCGFDGEGLYCHKGMLACTEWIYNDLMRHGKLEGLLSGKYHKYRLRLTGHSLGAGCAAILSMFLLPKYKNLRCLAFSPPGCVFSKNAAERCSSWVTSYVLHADVVPRLSIESFEGLRDSILEMICRIKVPKHRVLSYSSAGGGKGGKPLPVANEETLYEVDCVKASEFKTQVDEFKAFQSSLKEKNRSNYIELFPPGQIIQLFDTSEESYFKPNKMLRRTSDIKPKSEKRKKFTARWTQTGDLKTIIISTRVLFDHNPIAVKKRLQDVAAEFGLKPPYSNVPPLEPSLGKATQDDILGV